MLFRLDDAGDGEALQLGCRIINTLDLEADAGERLADRLQRGIGFEMVFQPGEGEFHGSTRQVTNSEVNRRD